ncbi:energy transducer TonB [Maribellus sediminis]|uniref:energy transducer TonB n=1 Tax=Maribellus sediminis TaxID=2696285 RepID=UPI00142FAEC2|nr:energy transducer TonB [Maribellus sediminis]
MSKIISITILLFISHALYSQENTGCDTVVYFVVEQMPLYLGDYNTFLENVSNQIDAETNSLLKNNNTNVNFQITCKGEAVITSTNSELTQFYNVLENELNKLQWIPARHNFKNVTVQSILPVRMINNKLNIPINFKGVRGELVKCKITDESSGIPVSNVRLITKYNDCSYFSNQYGEVEFYCEEKDEIEISHINYQSFSFSAPENASSFQIKLTNIVYELEPVDLTKYSPNKLPYKKSTCSFESWHETKQNQFMILGMGDFYAPELAVFNGGYECLDNYIVLEFVLPKTASEDNYTDTVDISFTIAEDGTLKNIVLSKTLNYDIDTIVRNIFVEMPKWKPATQARQKTKQSFVLKLIIGNNKYWEKYYG